MKPESINLTINGEIKDPIEIVLREGEAIKPSYPQKYSTAGVIGAPAEFAKKIKDKSNSIVEFSIKDLWIKLYENPTSKDAAIIEGKLLLNPELVAFAINKDLYITSNQLRKFILKYAHCFENISDGKDLIKCLENFEIVFEQAHTKSDDRKGNQEESVKSAIKYSKGELKTIWNLNMPLFIGSPKASFQIEIEIDRKETTPVFGFYSLELEVLLRAEAERLILGELSKFDGITSLQIS
jgi:hypothetical protein